MNQAHQLLYKSIKATVCTGAVALATSVSAQTPWQAAPAFPASLSANTTSTTPQQSGGPTGQASANANGSTPANQKQVINRYTTGTQQTSPPSNYQFAPSQYQPGQLQPGQLQPGQLQPGQLQPGQLQPGQLQPGQLAPGQLQPGQRTSGAFPQSSVNNFGQPTVGPQNTFPSTNLPQTQYGVAPTGQRPTFNPLGQSPQYPQPYQVQYQQQQQPNQVGQQNSSLPYQPPAMVPFNATSPNTIIAGGGYKAVDLPPPASTNTQPNSAASPAVPNNAPSNQLLAQDLVNAIQGTPASVPTASNSQTPSPQLSPTASLPNQPFAPPSSSPSSLRDLPGPGQLLPRNPPTPTQNGTPTQPPNNRGAIAQNSADPDAFQGRIPTINDLPVPDITLIDNTKNLLVSSQRSVDSGPVTSEPWNTRLVAIVGNERVLAGDMAAVIEPIIVQNKARLKSKKDEVDARMMLVRQLLPEYVSMKALQQQFFRDIAGNVPPKELQKKKDEMMSKASKAFYDKYVPIELYRRYKVDDLAELESKLQENGLAINIMKNHFLMQVLAMQCEDKYVATSFEIPPGDILDYYEKNIDKWRIPARVKWRELVIRFDKHSSKDEAKNAINNLGNEVFLTGKPFEAVARDSSEGHNAKDGGTYDWTTAGSLRSDTIEKAIFNLPLKRLSEVIEDDIGYHIVEVLEREPARIQDMSEIQSEIRTKLSNDIRTEKLKEFRQKILIRTPIWTMWPEDIQGSKPLVDVQESE